MNPIWCSSQLLYILTPSHSTSNAFYNLAVPEICVFCNKLEDEMHEDEDDKRYSSEPIPQQTDNQFEEEDGSFSPQLMHGNEDEDAIDPEEDKDELVEFYVRAKSSTEIFFHLDKLSSLCRPPCVSYPKRGH
ncbi:Cactin [Zea mays]|uniref:Cactin n=1 Tax=Zea mays TaxID=4577 RepID=A0A1D6KGS2_MAIZE|nr:Cactin [Zea mays]